MGEPSRSECVAGMDMLNDMFQRQARRLESQLYQRAQDQRTIELAQQQAQQAMAQVRQLEQHHLEQAARISQGSKSLQQLQEQMSQAAREHERALITCEALHVDVTRLCDTLRHENPRALDGLQLRSHQCPSIEQLRQAASDMEQSMLKTQRVALAQIGATPPTAIAMSREFNPLHDLSVVADYASKALTGPHAGQAAEQQSSPSRLEGQMGQYFIHTPNSSVVWGAPAASAQLQQG